MTEKFMDVHVFDGKLKGIFTPSRVYSVDEKTDAFNHLIKLLDNLAAVATVQTMINDLSFAKGANYQAENNLDSSDILMELMQCVDNPDALKGMNEQLADARNLGICPSGRATRLLQLWEAYVHADEEKVKNNNLDEE
tara:strand:+ start:152 stop:565 length:414 start_codon:yes stop_codon:yes gene_type:complete